MGRSAGFGASYNILITLKKLCGVYGLQFAVTGRIYRRLMKQCKHCGLQGSKVFSGARRVCSSVALECCGLLGRVYKLHKVLDSSHFWLVHPNVLQAFLAAWFYRLFRIGGLCKKQFPAEQIETRKQSTHPTPFPNLIDPQKL